MQPSRARLWGRVTDGHCLGPACVVTWTRACPPSEACPEPPVTAAGSPALEAALAGRTTGVGAGAPGTLTCVGYRGRPPVAMTMCLAESRVWGETEKAAVTQAPHGHLARAPLCPGHAAALRRP